MAALQSTPVVIVLVAAAPGKHRYRAGEIDLAIDYEAKGRLTIVPVVLQGGTDQDFPFPLRTIHALYEDKVPAGLSGIADLLSDTFPENTEQNHRTAEQARVSGAVLHVNMACRNPEDGANFIESQLAAFSTLFGRVAWIGLGNKYFTAIIPAYGSKARTDVVSKCLVFSIHLQLAVKGLQTAAAVTSGIQLTIAIHWEDDADVRILPPSALAKNTPYIIGSDLHHAQTIATVFADRSYILTTESVTRYIDVDLLPARIAAIANTNPDLKFASPPCDYRLLTVAAHDAHKQRYSANSLCLYHQGVTVVGDDRHPQERISIEYRTPAGETLTDNTFVQRLVQADRVVIVGITNENLERFLRAALKIRVSQRKAFWTELKIVFPNKQILDTIVDQHDFSDLSQARLLRREKWETGKRSVSHFLLSQPAADKPSWQCLEFSGALSFIGQKFLGSNLESIRIAPLLPGCDMKDAYYMEVFRDSHVFRELDKGFSIMVSKGKPLVEWNVCVSYQDQRLSFLGIIGRARLTEARDRLQLGARNPSFPICLIMLYTRQGFNSARAILQKRTMYNSARDFEKYSNISGWLISDDLWRACMVNAANLTTTPIYIPDLEREDDLQASFNFVDAIENKLRIGAEISGDLLSRATIECAVRELREELGLPVDARRLASRSGWISLPREDGSANLFRILSLEITHEELRNVQIRRPNSNLGLYEWADLQHLHGQRLMNHLLQNRFDDVFAAIYNEIGVRAMQ